MLANEYFCKTLAQQRRILLLCGRSFIAVAVFHGRGGYTLRFILRGAALLLLLLDYESVEQIIMTIAVAG